MWLNKAGNVCQGHTHWSIEPQYCVTWTNKLKKHKAARVIFVFAMEKGCVREGRLAHSKLTHPHVGHGGQCCDMLSHRKSHIGHTRHWSTKIEVFTRTLGQRVIGMGNGPWGRMMMIMTHSGNNGDNDDDDDDDYYDTFCQQCWGYRTISPMTHG